VRRHHQPVRPDDRAPLPLYLVRTAGYRPATIGVLFAIGSIGFLIGAATADHVGRRLGLGPAILIGATIAATSFLLIAATPARVAAPLIAAALFVYGTGALTFTVNNATLRQLTIESHLLGRTTAAMRQLTWIVQPIAGLLAAWLGNQLGLHTAIWIGALGALTAPLPLLTGELTKPATPAPQHTGNA
jgi:MFS family permease